MIRAAITLTTHIGVASGAKPQRTALSVISVNGSARTAKIAAIRQVQGFYRKIFLPPLSAETTGRVLSNSKDAARMKRAMDETLDALINIDY
jgi:hypothetical protein